MRITWFDEFGVHRLFVIGQNGKYLYWAKMCTSCKISLSETVYYSEMRDYGYNIMYNKIAPKFL